MPFRKPENLTEWLILLGVLGFVPTLFFYIVGEEGIYVITTMEMWHQHNWLQQLMYGADNGRPPLFNWLTMPVAAIIGWSHVVAAVRLVSVAATLGMVAWLYWLSRKLFPDKPFALFAALSCLCMADLALYRGWLTYTDPVFAFFTFAGMASLWVGAIEQRRGMLLASVILVSCAMLTKAFTAYIFYGTAGFVLLLSNRDTRRFLLAPRTLLTFSAAPALLLLWFSLAPKSGKAAGMLEEILHKLSAQDFSSYFIGLIEFPLDTLVRLSPVVLLALYLLMRKRVTQEETVPENARVALWIAVLGFLPYWLSPQNSIRYLLPIYPLIALVCARIIWRCGETGRTLALRWFAGFVAFKLVLMLALFPYYQTHYRGANYAMTAQRIIARTQGFPLYVNDVRSIGLSITSYIDLTRFPQAPLSFPPNDFADGYVLAMENNPELGQVAETYTLAADTTYLLCRGRACNASPEMGK